MQIKVQEVRSRIIEVPTDDFNEAKMMAKAILEEIPLNEDDSDGIQFFQD